MPASPKEARSGATKRRICSDSGGGTPTKGRPDVQTNIGDGGSTRTGDRTTYLNRFAYAAIVMLTGVVTRRGGTKNPKDQGRARTEAGAGATV